MPVVDALSGDLTDEASIMRWFTDELVANHRFTARFGDVNGGTPFTVTDALRWLDRPASETFYGDTDMLFGMRDSDSVRGQDSQPIGLGLQLGKALFATVGDPGSGNRWNDSTWTQDAGVLQHFPPPQKGTGQNIAVPYEHPVLVLANIFDRRYHQD